MPCEHSVQLWESDEFSQILAKVGSWQSLMNGRLLVLDFIHWLCSESKQNIQNLKCYKKKNYSWHLEYITSEKIFWSRTGNASFLPKYWDEMFSFICAKFSLIPEDFSNCSEKAGRNCDSLKIFEEWCCDFKCLAFVWSLGTHCCSAVHHDKQDQMLPQPQHSVDTTELALN